MRQNLFKQNCKALEHGNRTKPPPEAGQARPAHCLTLHMPDGRKLIFYYAFLLSVELLLRADHSILILRFTSPKIILKGYRLDILFAQYSNEKPAVIQVYNSRYIPQEMNRCAIVIEAIVEERNS